MLTGEAQRALEVLCEQVLVGADELQARLDQTGDQGATRDILQALHMLKAHLAGIELAPPPGAGRRLEQTDLIERSEAIELLRIGDRIIAECDDALKVLLDSQATVTVHAREVTKLVGGVRGAVVAIQYPLWRRFPDTAPMRADDRRDGNASE